MPAMPEYFDGSGNIHLGTPPGQAGGGLATSTPPTPTFDPSHIDPSQAFQGSQGASQLMGQISRAQWEAWKKRFAPTITDLADLATDPNAAQNAATQAKDSVGLAFDSANTINRQNREKFGLSLTQDQQQAQDRLSKIGRTAAMASAGNEARISALDRQKAILAGGLSLPTVPNGA